MFELQETCLSAILIRSAGFSGTRQYIFKRRFPFMTDQKNGQEYLSFVLEKLQARLAEISQSLLDGQKEI